MFRWVAKKINVNGSWEKPLKGERALKYHLFGGAQSSLKSQGYGRCQTKRALDNEDSSLLSVLVTCGDLGLQTREE